MGEQLKPLTVLDFSSRGFLPSISERGLLNLQASAGRLLQASLGVADRTGWSWGFVISIPIIPAVARFSLAILSFQQRIRPVVKGHFLAITSARLAV